MKSFWIFLIVMALAVMWALLVSAETDIVKLKAATVPVQLFGGADDAPPNLADLEKRVAELVNRLQLTHLFLSITATIVTIVSTLISIFGRRD